MVMVGASMVEMRDIDDGCGGSSVMVWWSPVNIVLRCSKVAGIFNFIFKRF